MNPISERDRRIVEQREQLGYPYYFIGREYGLTAQRISKIVKDATVHLNEIELELLKARKTDEALGLAIPHQPSQEARQDALGYLDWITSRLRDRGVEIKVDHRPTSEGSVFFITDTTDYAEGRNA